MEIKLVSKLPKDAALVFVLNEGEPITKHAFFKFLDKNDQSYILTFQKQSFIKEGISQLIFTPNKRKVLFIYVPKESKFNHRKALLAARRVVSFARTERLNHIAVRLEDFAAEDFDGSKEFLAEVIATQFEIANFEFVKYKTPPPDKWFFVQKISVFSDRPSATLALRLKSGKIIGEEINKARILSNTPGGDMTPDVLALAGKYAGKKHGFKVKILGEKEIKKLGMGGILGVSRGSAERPHFIVIEYLRGKKEEKPIVLVGKGVTFDTGGLNLKKDEGLKEMHMDMSGGAAVIHIVSALARLKTKKNIVGLIPAVENMPSGSSYRPGDLLKTMSGKTIEVLDTDAEGRIVLADALEYAKKYKPRLVIDIATLTGAAMVALGQRASAIFTTDFRLEKSLREIGEKTGDFVWPLPLWEEFEEDIKGIFGDVANTGKTKYGGAINGAVFLWQFIKDPSAGRGQIPWAHIDIAPRMTSIEGEYLAKGAVAPSVALLTHFLREFK
jgi:leucyl aminopeptidase